MTEPELLTLTPETCRGHLCCIIRTKKPHPGVETKRAWLAERLREGHVFRKLDVKGCAFIEYAPLETAWVPVLLQRLAARTRLGPPPAGGLHRGRAGAGEKRRLHAGRKEAEGVAHRPELCAEIRLRDGRHRRKI
ncbi:MAG: hypothetical protein V8S81_08330 [Oscillospiraceae bacterium]